MPFVDITGWNRGFNKVACTSALCSVAKLGLAEAKHMTDAVLQGHVQRVALSSAESASRLVALLHSCGAAACASQPPKALVFDLGGVLIDIDFGRAIDAWSAMSPLPVSELQRLFRFDPPYEQHERGEIDEGAYFRHLASLLQLSGPHERIEEGWNAIFIRDIAETRRLVEAVRRRVPCHAFSNTNASHMRKWSALFPGVVSVFDSIFASHEMGLRKPERAAFDFVCQSLALAPEDILFFDDLAGNVQGALDAGLRAVWVRSPEDVARALREEGLLD